MLARKAFVYFPIKSVHNSGCIQSFQHFSNRNYFVPERVTEYFISFFNFVPINFEKYLDMCIVHMPKNKTCIVIQFQNKKFSFLCLKLPFK